MVIQSKKVWLADQFVPPAIAVNDGRITAILPYGTKDVDDDYGDKLSLIHICLSEIRKVVSVPLVLHGTSGVPDDAVRECVARGMCKVNYATDLRIAFSKGLKLSLIHILNLYNVHFVVGLFGEPMLVSYHPNLYRNGIDTSGILLLCLLYTSRCV